MICKICRNDLESNKFILNQSACARCTYREKLKVGREKKYFCKTCTAECHPIRGALGRPKNVYCSEECSEIAHKRQIDEYWTRKLRGGTESYQWNRKPVFRFSY